MFELLRKYRAYLLWGYAFLLLIHFGFKDHFYITGIFFYSFPLPILILLIAPLLFLYYQKKVIRFTLIGFALFMSFYGVKNYYISYQSDLASDSNSILFWNISKQKDYNIEVIKEALETKGIDAIFFVEAIHKDNSFNTELNQHLKGYTFKLLEGNMMVVTKEATIKTIGYYKKNNSYRFNHIEVEIGSNLYDVGVVDIFASPFNNKRNAFNKIITYSEENDIDIILGDFNTPYGSVFFEDFKTKYTSCRGFQNGFSATWPSLFPLLEIDQIWISKKLKILKTEKEFHDNSDHAKIVTYFTEKLN